MCKFPTFILVVFICFTEFSESIFTGQQGSDTIKCLPNTIGEACDECKEYHFNSSTPAGCIPCDCHQDGSYWEQCSEDRGQCHCKPGYGGRRCNQCLTPGNPDIKCEQLSPDEIEGLTSSLQSKKPDAASKECDLPSDPANRLYCPYNCPECSINPYSSCSYPSRSQKMKALRVECLPGYGLVNGQDHGVSVCVDQKWVPPLPECQKVCPPLVSEFLDVRCFNELTEVSCKQTMMPGIWATYKCRPSHKQFPNLALAGIYDRTLICRQDGHWSGSLPECDPICGVSKGNDTLTPTIVNGTATKLGQFPWHAGLYRRNNATNDSWDNVCGGSIITNRIVLSAAHCIGITAPRDFRVALGKYFRVYERDEKDTVKRDVIAIKLPSEYKGGATSYTWDIALILMNATVQFNSLIMPVCMNLGSHLRLTNGDSGYVVGWGKTSPGGQESEKLLYNVITIMAEQDCQRSIALFLSFDKFCGSKKAVSVVQQGDSGGGLTAEFGGLHYIFGVVSIKSKEIPMFTNISWESHKRWIDRELLNIVNVNTI